jgi:hypothetical protein
MPRFRKKPIEVEARQFAAEDDAIRLIAWIGGRDAHLVPAGVDDFDPSAHIAIHTLESHNEPLYANLGDWIIKGIAGEFYPCKPEIFAATYEEVL